MLLTTPENKLYISLGIGKLNMAMASSSLAVTGLLVNVSHTTCCVGSIHDTSLQGSLIAACASN